MLAIEVEIDGIRYNLNAEAKQATVIKKSSGKYSGEVVIPESVVYDGTAYSVTSIGGNAFYNCSGLTSVTIPNSVTSIGKWAFYDCSGLTSVTIPNSVTSIGEWAFSDCSGLTSVTIPNSVTSIGERAFKYCSGLTSVTIGNSVESIGRWAFSGCSGLTSVTIPNSVTSIGLSVFAYCSGLTSIVVEEGNTVYDSRNNCNAIIETASNTLHLGCKTTVIPNSVTSIGDNAFDGCSGLTSVTIPNSVKSIGFEAFLSCKGLTSVTIPNSVKSIGAWAFQDCLQLLDVYCYAEDMPSTDSRAFAYSPIENATLHVPAGSVESYRKTEPWSGFGTITPLLEDLTLADGEEFENNTEECFATLTYTRTLPNMLWNPLYVPFKIPYEVFDKEYLRGLPDADKMTNFKEFVIRSDAKTREQFENRDTHWAPLANMLDNKTSMQKFYLGFLSQMYLFAGNGIDGCPESHRFHSAISDASGGGINYPMNPNYVACLIPYKEGERDRTIVPEFAATGSSLRYTSVQGYSESKEFYSPDYSNMHPKADDYRRTLIWVPEIEINENGEAVVELYNTRNCNNILVDVAGRNGTSLYSNDAVTTTRINNAGRQRATNVQTQGKAVEKKEEALSPEVEEACAWEHQKGVIYFNKGNYRDAVTIFAELVQYKYAPAMYYVSLCYRDGKGVGKNPTASMKFLLEAAKRGYGPAQYDLAVEFDKGDVIERNDSLANQWYETAAANNEPRALLEMSHRYRNGRNVVQDNEKSTELLKRAADLKEPTALFEYAELLIADGKNGYQYMEAAADMGNEKAMIYMFDYLDGQQRYKDAYKYAKALSEAGNHEGTRRIADYYLEGKGVSRDKRLAKDLYYEAARAGNKVAKEKLRNL